MLRSRVGGAGEPVLRPDVIIPVAQKITDVLRKPETILEAGRPQGWEGEKWKQALGRLHNDIQVALLCDPGNCPEADVTRREMGASLYPSSPHTFSEEGEIDSSVSHMSCMPIYSYHRSA